MSKTKNIDQENVGTKRQQNRQRQQKNKKMLLWGILIVVVGIVLYVLFGDDLKQYRLNTEVRNTLPTVSSDSAANTSNTTSSSPVATTTAAPASSSLSVDSASASAVRKELANLFRSYA
jgi:cytoskeletal protein RodZ